MADDEHENIRDVIGALIGCRLVDITQDDVGDAPPAERRVYLHFNNGATLSFVVDEDHGFDVENIEDEP